MNMVNMVNMVYNFIFLEGAEQLCPINPFNSSGPVAAGAVGECSVFTPDRVAYCLP